MKSDYEKCLDMKVYQQKSCKWSLNKEDGVQKPHGVFRGERKKIFDNVIEVIGNTPMVRLNNISAKEGIKCDLIAKCEFFNPGGSTKDRIAQRMIHDLEETGKIDSDSTIIEATSGNTGIGVAMVGAAKGYKVIITLPEKMSQEKSDTLKGLGAKIIRTPTEVPCDHVDSHIGVAIKLNKEIENSVIPDQYVNPGNSLAHYDGTAEEIWEQCEGKLDYVVIAAGTGGTMTGIGRKLKEKDKNIQIIGVDPEGSILAYPDSLNEKNYLQTYKVEGTGYDFIPKNCDRFVADKWIKSNDKETFYWARRLIREEGLLVGGSSGSVAAAAVELCKTLPEGKRVVVVLVDSVRNYISKFLNDDWMIENGFYEQDEIDANLEAFGDNEKISSKLSEFTEVPFVLETDTTKDVLEKMDNLKLDCLPVNTPDSKLVGIITKQKLTGHLLSFTLTKEKEIRKAIIKDFKQLSSSQPMKYLSKAFSRHNYSLVTDNGKYYLVQASDMLRIMN